MLNDAHVTKKELTIYMVSSLLVGVITGIIVSGKLIQILDYAKKIHAHQLENSKT